MKTIGDLWVESGKKVGLKVRWKDWGHKHIFFTIQKYNETTNSLLGELSCGESTSYKFTSTNWKVYEDGDETTATAV